MASIPEVPDNGRQAAHIFLDLLQVLDYGEDSVELAAQRFFESGSVTVDFDEENKQLDLDFSRMIVGGVAVIKALVSVTASNWGLSVDETVEKLRELIDSSLT
jgi:hypothetical protein